MFGWWRKNLPLLGSVATIIVVSAGPLSAQPVTLSERILSLLDEGAGPPQTPHPSVARIIVPEGNGTTAFGSGTLIDANDTMGLVVTNWHVVHEAKGQISVRFPDGFESPAQVLKMDRDWDLAALAIRRPSAAPVRLSSQSPKPGDSLTIAGYGSGNYRSVTGRCTQYVAPSLSHPYEMVELHARARQGDSGGPIFNSRGELAGVLFGEGGGTTSGSYCGRVHQFLAGLRAPAPFTIPQQQPTPILAKNTAGPNKAVPANPPAVSNIIAVGKGLEKRGQNDFPENSSDPFSTMVGGSDRMPGAAVFASAPRNDDPGWRAHRDDRISTSTASLRSSSSDDDWAQWQALLGPTQPERIKTILAAIGVVLLILHTHRWVSAPEKSGN